MTLLDSNIIKFLSIQKDGLLKLAINNKRYDYQLDCEEFWNMLIKRYSYPIRKGSSIRRINNSVLQTLKPFLIK